VEVVAWVAPVAGPAGTRPIQAAKPAVTAKRMQRALDDAGMSLLGGSAANLVAMAG
jgi:hypothetical protein